MFQSPTPEHKQSLTHPCASDRLLVQSLRVGREGSTYCASQRTGSLLKLSVDVLNPIPTLQ
jgi:hypothetical protein